MCMGHSLRLQGSVYYSRQLYTVSIRFHGGAELFFGLNPQAESSLQLLHNNFVGCIEQA